MWWPGCAASQRIMCPCLPYRLISFTRQEGYTTGTRSGEEAATPRTTLTMLPSLDAAWRRFRPFEAGAPCIQPIAARQPADRCPVFCPSSSGSSLLPLPWPRFLLDCTARFLPSPAPVLIVIARWSLALRPTSRNLSHVLDWMHVHVLRPTSASSPSALRLCT